MHATGATDLLGLTDKDAREAFDTSSLGTAEVEEERGSDDDVFIKGATTATCCSLLCLCVFALLLFFSYSYPLHSLCHAVLMPARMPCSQARALTTAASRLPKRAGCIACRQVPKGDMKRMGHTTGATVLLSLVDEDAREAFDTSSLEAAEEGVEERVGDDDIVFIKITARCCSLLCV